MVVVVVVVIELVTSTSIPTKGKNKQKILFRIIQNYTEPNKQKIYETSESC